MNGVRTEPAYRLRVLGPAHVEGPDRERVPFESRKHLVLLYFLARHPGRPVSRDEVTDLFWHGDDERKARHSLSHAVSLINKALRAEAVVADGANRIALRDGFLELDVREFEKLVADGEHIRARDLWNGTVFEGYTIRRAPKLDEWITTERARLERTFRRTLHQVIEEHRAAGDHESMRREAEELLGLDELDERGMLAYLQALVLMGDRTLALRTYGEFEKRIAAELKSDPTTELASWARRNRRPEPPQVPQRSPRASDYSVLPAARPLYGRDAEFALLWQSWENARNGEGCFWILEGPAGIGKTALAGKLANQVHVTGGSVGFVKCYRTDKSVPFAPITTLVRQLARLPGFTGTGAPWIGELTRLYPELRERFSSAPEPMAIDDSARHRICDAVIEATSAVSEEQPLLILLDDILDADDASIALIHYLGRQITRRSALVLCTVRSSANWPDTERTFLETARAARLARFMLLDALPRAAITRVAAQVLAQTGLNYSDTVLEEIADGAAGNPLLAIESCMAVPRDNPSIVPPTTSPTPIEDTFDQSSLERLRRLDQDAITSISALAVSGRPLTEYELSVVTGLQTAQLASSVLQLERGQFIRRTIDTISIAHERYIGTAESIMSPALRTRLHLAFTRLLGPRARQNPSIRFEYALHLRGAGMSSTARRESLRAAAFAGSIGAIRSQAAALELAVDLGSPIKVPVAVDLARCYLLLNDLDALDRLCHQWRRREPRSADVSYFEIAAAIQSGARPLSQGSTELQSLLSLRTSFATESEALLLLLRVADKTFMYSAVKSAARRLRRFHQTSFGLFATAYTRSKYYWAVPALECLRAALEAAQSEGNWMVEQLCHDGIGIALKQIGKYRDSIHQFDYSLGLARKTMNPHAEIACLQNRAVTEMCLGEYEAMAESHQEAESIAAGIGTNALFKFRAYNDGLVRMFEGDYEQANRHFERVYEESTTGGFPILAAQAAAGSAIVCARTSNTQGLRRAASLVRQLIPANDRMSCTWIDYAALAYDDLVNGRVEQHQVTGRLVRRCRELASRDVSFGLALEYESICVEETITRCRQEERRQELAISALAIEAAGVRKLALATS